MSFDLLLPPPGSRPVLLNAKQYVQDGELSSMAFLCWSACLVAKARQPGLTVPGLIEHCGMRRLHVVTGTSKPGTHDSCLRLDTDKLKSSLGAYRGQLRKTPWWLHTGRAPEDAGPPRP